MRSSHRVLLALAAAVVAALPVSALAATALANYAGTYYVTEIGNGAVAKVDVNGTGVVQVHEGYVSGLHTGGPDSAVFAPDGSLIVSNYDTTIARVDVTARKVVTPVINKTPLDGTADLAVDPKGDDVVVIGWSQSGPLAIARVALDSGATTALNPSGVNDLGGVAFSDGGSRLFVSSHGGVIYELNPSNGRVVRKVSVNGAPDGLTYDPSTGYLYASGCGGLCEIATGGDGGSSLTLRRVLRAADGDGIAADGHGHVFIAESSCGSLCVVNIASDTSMTIAQSIGGADDVTPLVGAGSPAGTACLNLGSCFDGALAAGIGVASIALVVYLGASALGGGTPVGGGSLRPAPAGAFGVSHLGGGHLAAGHAMVAAAHPPPAPPHPAVATTATHPPPQPPGDAGLAAHVQEEAGEKILEVGGAGLEEDAAVTAAAAATEEESATGLEPPGGARVARDQRDEPPPPPAPASPPL